MSEIILPSTMESIGSYAFLGCSITSITIPNGITSIAEGTFYGCSNLTSIAIPDSVTSIERFAFKGCNNLTTLMIPNSVSSLSSDAFAECDNLTLLGYSGSCIERMALSNNWAYASSNDISYYTIELDVPFYYYNGNEVCPEPKVSLFGNELKINTDYSVSYFNNNKAGKATIVVTGIGDYLGEKALDFYIINTIIESLPWSSDGIISEEKAEDIYEVRLDKISSVKIYKFDELEDPLNVSIYDKNGNILSYDTSTISTQTILLNKGVNYIIVSENGSYGEYEIQVELLEEYDEDYFTVPGKIEFNHPYHIFSDTKEPLEFTFELDQISTVYIWTSWNEYSLVSDQNEMFITQDNTWILSPGEYHLLLYSFGMSDLEINQYSTDSTILHLSQDKESAEYVQMNKQYYIKNNESNRVFVPHYDAYMDVDGYFKIEIENPVEIEFVNADMLGDYSGPFIFDLYNSEDERIGYFNGERYDNHYERICLRPGTYYFMVIDSSDGSHGWGFTINSLVEYDGEYVTGGTVKRPEKINLDTLYVAPNNEGEYFFVLPQKTGIKGDYFYMEEGLIDEAGDFGFFKQRGTFLYSDYSRGPVQFSIPKVEGDFVQFIVHSVKSVEDIQLTKQHMDVLLGESFRLPVKVYPEDAWDQQYGVSSNDCSVIDSVGYSPSEYDCYAKGVGTATVYAYSYWNESIVSEPCEITVRASIEQANISIHSEQIYTGEALRPDIHVELHGTNLSEDIDYRIVFVNNTNAGTATATITGIGNYTGTIKKNFTINPKPFTSAITLSTTKYVYDGSAKKPIVTVKDGNATLKNGIDYTLAYKNNTNVGTATVIITGKGNYTGSKSVIFRITPKSIGGLTIGSIAAKTYSGSAFKPLPVVKDGTITLKNGTDYTVSYKNNTNAGTATVTFTGKGNYTGTKSVTFKINPKPMSGMTIGSIAAKTYSGSAFKPLPIVKNGTITLKNGTDYTVSYKNNTNAGIATVTFTGKGNYNGTKSVTFKINKAAQTVTAKAAASAVAVGKSTTISVTGAKGTKSYKSSDTTIATVSSTGTVTAKKVGTVKITVTSAATTNYNAKSVTVTIKVVPAAAASVTAANQATGFKVIWKKVTGATGYYIYRNGTQIKKITSGSTLTYTDTAANTNGAKYVYKVTAYAGTGTSTLSKSVTTYRVARPAISSLTNSAAGKMTVKWGKNAKSTGYQIQYSTSSTFASGNKTVTVTANSTVSKVISSLTKGKTYYVRVRTYKTVGTAKYYSAWSPVKKCKDYKVTNQMKE